MHITRTALPPTLVAACFALAACQDAPTAPDAVGSADSVATVTAPVINPSAVVAGPTLGLAAARLEALRDALTRVQPTLVRDDRSTALATELRTALAALERGDTKGAERAFKDLETTMGRFGRRESQAADVEVIRLAVRAASAR